MVRSIMLAVAACTLGASLATAEPKKDIGYDARADAFAQLDSAVAAAKAEDKLVLLISGGDWCIWCHYLADFLERETAVDEALHDVFVVQKVYVGDENLNKEFFARLPKAAGAPHFWVLSATGEVLKSQDTLPFEDGKKSYVPSKLMAFVDEWRKRPAAH
ncbi:MAG TPA: thioredoxin family protein [Gammaproteobacteria bacterium]|nr:thioredoxin family protein [Gammaproteobacteria bacterium]